MNLAAAKHFLRDAEKCGGFYGGQVMKWLIAEVERLNEDREWQIKQNERMFTALDQIAKHLKLPCDKRDDGVLDQIVEAAMIID